MIIDTDCGIDDAQAIMMALAAPNIHILGVTCVFGNTTVDNVCQNVLRVLSVCERNGVRLLKLSEQSQSEEMQICVMFLNDSFSMNFLLNVSPAVQHFGSRVFKCAVETV